MLLSVTYASSRETGIEVGGLTHRGAVRSGVATNQKPSGVFGVAGWCLYHLHSLVTTHHLDALFLSCNHPCLLK